MKDFFEIVRTDLKFRVGLAFAGFVTLFLFAFIFSV